MKTSYSYDEALWQVRISGDTLTLVHEHRWLGIVGVPMAMIGTAVMAGLWFLPGLDVEEAWPFLAVGSLIGFGAVLLGLHLTFGRTEIQVDRAQGTIRDRRGVGPLVRTRIFRIGEFESLRLIRPHRGSYLLLLIGKRRSVQIAGFVDPEPVMLEAVRWADFLDLPIIDESA